MPSEITINWASMRKAALEPRTSQCQSPNRGPSRKWSSSTTRTRRYRAAPHRRRRTRAFNLIANAQLIRKEKRVNRASITKIGLTTIKFKKTVAKSKKGIAWISKTMVRGQVWSSNQLKSRLALRSTGTRQTKTKKMTIKRKTKTEKKSRF